MSSRQSCSVAKFLSAVIPTCLLVLALMTQPAQAQKFKVFHTFHGKDGVNPIGELVRDAAGNIYGTTGEGGSGKCGDFGCGTAFKMSKAGKLIWTHSFNSANGETPYAGLLRDTAGNLYGTTDEGGDRSCTPPYGCGTLFKLNTTGKETVIHKFSGSPDGNTTEALLVKDSVGNLYGTTLWGGTSGIGTVFEVDAAGKEMILHNFTGSPDGEFPYTGVIRDAAGSLYGVTDAGGEYCCGTVYKIDTASNETVLYSFTGGSDGDGPDSVLLADPEGNLYGTTKAGGNSGCAGSGCGVIFEVSPHSDGTWTESVLYAFCSLSNCADGRLPGRGPLVRDATGNLYGTTSWGGTSPCHGSGCGVVFELDTTGKETVLHSFTGGKDGAFPLTGLTLDTRGNLYGATLGGGDLSCTIGTNGGCGVLFKISP
jgi:uncharacterized repeat protein (TIGR03803 family)